MTTETALIAMSGGVDSSVAALLMQQAGYRCAGATLQLCSPALLGDLSENRCSTPQSVADAQSISQRLGMPFYVLDAAAAFQENVVDHFVRCYERGDTPNPCLNCNRWLKFGFLLDYALEHGYDKIATGHYANIRKDEATGRYLLFKAADSSKDQTYFLSSLSQHQLSHILFPLGGFTKAQIRAIAEEAGFTNAKKKDSQDVCFIPDGDYVAFMRRYTGKEYSQGDFLDLLGRTVGRHNGTVGYTIGQRKGLGLAMGSPVYVCSKDVQRNTVTVGPNEALFRCSLRANNWNWLPFPDLTAPLRVTAKIRYRHTEQPATVYPEADGFARVEFDEPQRAITSGQAVVLYHGDQVIGSGTITDVL